MPLDRNINLRVSDSWLSTIDQLLESFAGHIKRDRSQLIRELVSQHSHLWKSSPYIATHSRHFILVAANGHMFYRVAQRLFLNQQRYKLPMSIKMKPEKQEYWFKRNKDSSEDIRKNWIINHFTAWPGDDMASKPIRTHVDRNGITAKSADLIVDLPPSTTVTREMLVANRDYVQHEADEPSRGLDPMVDMASARCDAAVDIPTLALDLQAVVDLDLYESNPTKGGSANLNYEIRNREFARFESNLIPSQANPITWNSGRHVPGAKHHGKGKDVLQTVQSSFNEFKGRFHHLAEEQVLAADDKPVVDNADDRELLHGIELPERYLFGQLQWTLPFLGLEVCLTWPKPD